MANEDEVAALETSWSERDVDNYKDILETINDLIDSSAAQPALRARVVAVLNDVITEIEELADPTIDEYLGEWGTRAFWEQLVGGPLKP